MGAPALEVLKSHGDVALGAFGDPLCLKPIYDSVALWSVGRVRMGWLDVWILGAFPNAVILWLCDPHLISFSLLTSPA